MALLIHTSKVEWNAHYQIMKKVGILTDNQMLRWASENVCKSRGMSTLLNDFFHFSIPSWSEIQKSAHLITIANYANNVRNQCYQFYTYCFLKNWFDEAGAALTVRPVRLEPHQYFRFTNRGYFFKSPIYAKKCPPLEPHQYFRACAATALR